MNFIKKKDKKIKMDSYEKKNGYADVILRDSIGVIVKFSATFLLISFKLIKFVLKNLFLILVSINMILFMTIFIHQHILDTYGRNFGFSENNNDGFYEIFSNVEENLQERQTQRDLNNNENEKIVKYFKNHFVSGSCQENENCPICFDNIYLSNEVIKTDCDHFYHKQCLKPWIERNIKLGTPIKCPQCRTNINI